MKWFQPVCISVEETNKDNYCQQIPFYPPCRVCLGRLGTPQPESIGLLRQSALAFYVFLFIPHSREPFSNSHYTQGLGDGRGLQNKAAHFSHTFGKAGICGREKETAAVGERLHINVCKFPHSCWLRLEKLISWMQRQYWCHQAESSGTLLTPLCLQEKKDRSLNINSPLQFRAKMEAFEGNINNSALIYVTL